MLTQNTLYYSAKYNLGYPSGTPSAMLSPNGQDDPFAGLVAARQFKQALNLCEKKLKKTKNDEYLQASPFI